jgi:hypothetical protein
MNHQILIFALAATVTAVYLQNHIAETQKSVANCQAEFRSFKEGVVYGK